MPDPARYVLWQFRAGRWSRATNPLPSDEAQRMRDTAIVASGLMGQEVVYRILPEHLTPEQGP